MKKWERFTREELEQFVRDSRSYRDLSIRCGYAKDGGSIVRIAKELVEHYGFNVDHFTGQGWNKDNFDYSRLENGRTVKPRSMIQALIALRGHRCEICKNEEWNSLPIPLEVHHLDGNSLNNFTENLQLCCPNCHSQTGNYKGRNINKGMKVSDEDFITTLKESPNVRQALLKLGLTAKGGNYSRAYDLINKHQIVFLQGAPSKETT